MYLPETNETEHRVQNLNGRKIGEEGSVTRRKLNNGESIEREIASFRLKNSCKNVGRSNKSDKDGGEDGNEREERGEEAKRRKEKRRDEIEDASTNRRRDDKSLKNHRVDENGCRERNEFSSCPEPAKQRRTFSPPSTNDPPQISWICDANETKSQRKSNSRGKRFTFQSTVRQIERRRLAEKLSREAEAKERQRKGELEAMRKVEEEFQRKRAKEKASIRQQLRLFKEMEENFKYVYSHRSKYTIRFLCLFRAVTRYLVLVVACQRRRIGTVRSCHARIRTVHLPPPHLPPLRCRMGTRR